MLADLGSSNGTWVNGRRFDGAGAPCAATSALWIGDTVLELSPDQAPAGETRVAAPSTESPLRRRASQISDIALLRPPPAAGAGAVAGRDGPHDQPRADRSARCCCSARSAAITLLIIGVETGPVAFSVAVGLAFLPVPFYLALVLWIDRNEREPTWMIVMTFFWGACVAVFIALILNSVGELVVSDAFGRAIGELYGFSISAPVVEESAKGLVLFIIYRRARSEFNGVLDGIVYAAIVGLGFAATENVLYYGRGIMEDLQDHHLFSADDIGVSLGTFIVRGVFSPFAHPLFTSMTGIGLGIASRSTKRSTRFWAPVLGLLGAMFLHSLWNTSAIFGAAFIAVYLFVLMPLFVGLLFVIRGTLQRERQTIGQYLAYSVQQGDLTPGELYVLTDGRLRKLALREAKAIGGKAGARPAPRLPPGRRGARVPARANSARAAAVGRARGRAAHALRGGVPRRPRASGPARVPAQGRVRGRRAAIRPGPVRRPATPPEPAPPGYPAPEPRPSPGTPPDPRPSPRRRPAPVGPAYPRRPTPRAAPGARAAAHAGARGDAASAASGAPSARLVEAVAPGRRRLRSRRRIGAGSVVARLARARRAPRRAARLGLHGRDAPALRAYLTDRSVTLNAAVASNLGSGRLLPGSTTGPRRRTGRARRRARHFTDTLADVSEPIGNLRREHDLPLPPLRDRRPADELRRRLHVHHAAGRRRAGRGSCSSPTATATSRSTRWTPTARTRRA